jgi:hypothetical protein
MDGNLGTCALLSKMRGCKLGILKFDPGGGLGAQKNLNLSQITHFSHSSQAKTFIYFCEIALMEAHTSQLPVSLLYV